MSETAGTPGSTPASQPVVTIFETYGAGADYIGRGVAEALGVRYHRQLFSSEEFEEAEEAEAAGAAEGRLTRVLRLLARSVPAEDGRVVAAAEQERIDLAQQNAREVQQQAEEGCVIVGRDASLILAERPATLHVLLDGPVDERIERAAKEHRIDTATAAKRQAREDRLRVEMSKDYYGQNPLEPSRYSMVLNTGRMDLDACIQVIVTAMTARSGRTVA